MTDPELVQKKLAFIETCVRQLRDLTRIERIGKDVREDRFVERTLQIAIQAAQDVASHIVSDARLGEPRTNKELFDLLARGRWLDEDQARTLRLMVGFRNVVVHGYEAVDPDIVRDIVENRLDDLLDYVAAIRRGMKSET